MRSLLVSLNVLRLELRYRMVKFCVHVVVLSYEEWHEGINHEVEILESIYKLSTRLYNIDSTEMPVIMITLHQYTFL